jgi:hypothetical protein
MRTVAHVVEHVVAGDGPRRHRAAAVPRPVEITTAYAVVVLFQVVRWGRP